MKQPVFEGLATAIVTPFRNGTIDIPTFEKLLDAQLAANVDAIVVCGTTGESATLSSSEQLTLIAHAMQYTAGRCKIIAGTGSNDTAHAIDLSRAASSMGVSAALIVTPYYNKCTQSGLIAHYEAIADAIACPVICYNVPSRTGLDLKLETCQALAKHSGREGSGRKPGENRKDHRDLRRQLLCLVRKRRRGRHSDGAGRERAHLRSLQRAPQKDARDAPRVPEKRFPNRWALAAGIDSAHRRTLLRGQPHPGQKGAGTGGLPGRASAASADRAVRGKTPDGKGCTCRDT